MVCWCVFAWDVHQAMSISIMQCFFLEWLFLFTSFFPDTVLSGKTTLHFPDIAGKFRTFRKNSRQLATLVGMPKMLCPRPRWSSTLMMLYMGPDLDVIASEQWWAIVMLMLLNNTFCLRSPWSNQYYPDLDDGALPSDKLRQLEIDANAAFDIYRDMLVILEFCSFHLRKT